MHFLSEDLENYANTHSQEEPALLRALNRETHLRVLPPRIAFIDADKKNYLNYLEVVLPKMSHGGVILSDNVLWSGKVVEPLKESDKHTQILMEYNQRLATDPRLETVLLPIRDGISIARVK